jgi:hypothetical protein
MPTLSQLEAGPFLSPQEPERHDCAPDLRNLVPVRLVVRHWPSITRRPPYIEGYSPVMKR